MSSLLSWSDWQQQAGQHPSQLCTAKQGAAQLWSQEFCSTFNNELVWIWLVILAPEKNTSLLINRRIQIQARLEPRWRRGCWLVLLYWSGSMNRLTQTVTRRGQMAGDPHFYSNRTMTDSNVQILLNGLQWRLLQSIAYLLFTETNLSVKRKLISL